MSARYLQQKTTHMLLNYSPGSECTIYQITKSKAKWSYNDTV